MSSRNKVYLAGMTCLSCGKGRYDGYQPYPTKKTLPCEVCGDVRPSSMNSNEFIKVVQARDTPLEEIKLITGEEE
jgi:hypothetical protein